MPPSYRNWQTKSVPSSDEQALFLGTASQQGYPAEVALPVYTQLVATLRERGHGPALYVYRVAEHEGDSDTASATPPFTRPRTLLAFATADTALGFAQRMRLRGSPRLRRIAFAHLLAVMLQQPAIRAVLVVDEPLVIPVGQHFPTGYTISRTDLHEMLKGAAHGEPL